MKRSNIKHRKMKLFFPCFFSASSFLHHPHCLSHSWLPLCFQPCRCSISALRVKTLLPLLETLGVFMLHNDQHSACLQIASLTKLLVGSSVLLSLWDTCCDYQQLILPSFLEKLGERVHLLFLKQSKSGTWISLSTLTGECSGSNISLGYAKEGSLVCLV